MCKAKPDAMGTIRVVPAAIATAAPAILAADLDTMKKEGIKGMEQFFKHQMLMAGLCNDVRIEVMEASKATLQESMWYAQELEVILHDKRVALLLMSPLLPPPVTCLLLQKMRSSPKKCSRLSDRGNHHSSPISTASMKMETMVNPKLLFAVSARSLATFRRIAGLTSVPML